MWGIVVDRVLSAPLLEQEDDNGNEESRPVAFAQECLAKTEVSSGDALLANGSLYLGELVADPFVISRELAEIS